MNPEFVSGLVFGGFTMAIIWLVGCIAFSVGKEVGAEDVAEKELVIRGKGTV